jgi:hypothetical protein
MKCRSPISGHNASIKPSIRNINASRQFSEGAAYVLEANGIGLVRPGEEAAGIDGVRKGLEEWQASSNLSSSSM